MNRFLRGLSQRKGNKVKSALRSPLSTEGDDGDMQIYNGRLYIKDNNIWYSYSGDSDVTSSAPTFCTEIFPTQTGIGTTPTTVQFNTILTDSANGFDVSDYKYHIQDGYAGFYFIGVDLIVDHSHIGNWAELQLIQTHSDGSTAKTWIGYTNGDGITAGQYISVSKNSIFNVSTGDTFHTKVKAQANTLDVQSGSLSVFYGFKIN